MLTSFKVIEGQSVYDLVLNTYGTLNLLGKLIVDNDIDDINALTVTGQVVWYDDLLIADYNLFNSIQQNNTKLRTGVERDFLITDSGIDIETDAGQNFIV